MKKITNCKEIWTDYDVLLHAFNRCKDGKSFRDYVLAYELNLATNIASLQKRLIEGTYCPRPMREFYIYEPKTRLIQAPYFEDRIVHHALLFAIQRHIERKFYYHSYACQKGKGVHAASLKLASWVKSTDVFYYLKLDLSKFFYSIDHQKLLPLIEGYVDCVETLRLLKLFFMSESAVGLPLGNVTSQMLANLFLTPLDNYVKRVLKVKRYIRYMDDFIILEADITKLRGYKILIAQFLGEQKLKLNPKFRVDKISKGIDFCGFRHWPGKRLIRKKTLYKLNRALRKPKRDVIVSYLGLTKDTQSFRYIIKMIAEKCCNEIRHITHKFTLRHRKKIE
jgi:retron-type reverse transcriptase